MVGGACGAIHARDGRRYAYLAMMAVAADAPAGTGTRLGGLLRDALARQGVSAIDLGTQTAAPFYERLGFHTTLRLVPSLRFRQGPNGGRIWHDLVMMRRTL